MKLRSIETTPSPNCMKLNLDAPVSTTAITLNQGHGEEVKNDHTNLKAPAFAQKLMAIAGVKSVFIMDDFITLTRRGIVDWQPILTAAGNLIGLSDAADSSLAQSMASSCPDEASTKASTSPTQNFGQVEVAVQMFREIPVQVRATSGSGEESRVALPERFAQALQRAIGATGANYVAERRWAPYQPQFGNLAEIAQQVTDELVALISEQDLAQLEQRSIDTSQANGAQAPAPSQQKLLAELQQSNWKRRLKAVQQIKVDDNTFATIVALLKDDKVAIRRWAAALLGSSECAEAVQPLHEVLQEDTSAIVRRTAGDALSDLGDLRASEAMIAALQDTSSLVRWRASRFLTELGDETAVEPLIQAIKTETEFDVRVEMQAAIERIQSGGEVQLPMWMRISQSSNRDE
ncbi:MAG: virulence factor [Cyanobacteria bacterium P01_H01_bin.58]